MIRASISKIKIGTEVRDIHAIQLTNERKITLDGAVTGTGYFDGSGDLTITTSTNHTHNYAGSSSAGGGAKKNESYQVGSITTTYGNQWHVINQWITNDRLKIQILNDGAVQSSYPIEVNHAYKLVDPSTAYNKTTALLSKGSATQPVYFSEGVPVACTYSINATVPANAKFTDTVYTHPTTSGNKHIPSGGSSGQILRWSADGTAVWGNDNNSAHGHSAGVGLTGSGSAGTSGTYTYKVNLVNETAASNAASYTAGGTSKFYAVQLDKNNKLGVYVPWTDNNTVYSHPAGSGASKTSGFYKFSTDSTSHISGVTAVTKADITALGIPAQDTTYGSMSINEGTTGTATTNRVLTAANLKGIINAHAPTKTGGGASGTWGISITGSAGSVAWSNVTGKPSSFPPESHTHNYAGSSSAGGAANSVKTNLIIKLNGGTTEGTNLFTFNGSTAKTINITPASIGAAASSHGTHVTYSSTAPVMDGTANVGSASTVARSDHRHPTDTTRTSTSVLPNDNGEIKTKYRIAQKGNAGTANWYYKICDLPANNDSNYASAIISGRIGGWVSGNMSYINALVWNRGTPGIALIDIAGNATSMSSIWSLSDLALYVNSSGTATLYIKCNSYFTFDLDLELFQSTASITYDGTYITTTPSGTLAALGSTTTKRIEVVNNNLYVNGTAASLKGHKHTVTYAKSATATGSTTQGGTNAETSITPAGTISQPTFTGTAHTHTFTPTTTKVYSISNVGTMFAASVSGEVLILTPGAVPSRSEVTVATGGSNSSVAATGTVSKPTFTGTAAKHTHTFTGSAHTHAITLTNTTVTSSGA